MKNIKWNFAVFGAIILILIINFAVNAGEGNISTFPEISITAIFDTGEEERITVPLANHGTDNDHIFESFFGMELIFRIALTNKAGHPVTMKRGNISVKESLVPGSAPIGALKQSTMPHAGGRNVFMAEYAHPALSLIVLGAEESFSFEHKFRPAMPGTFEIFLSYETPNIDEVLLICHTPQSRNDAEPGLDADEEPDEGGKSHSFHLAGSAQNKIAAARVAAGEAAAEKCIQLIRAQIAAHKDGRLKGTLDISYPFAALRALDSTAALPLYLEILTYAGAPALERKMAAREIERKANVIIPSAEGDNPTFIIEPTALNQLSAALGDLVETDDMRPTGK